MRCRRGLLQQCGRGPVCFQPKAAGSGWLVHHTSLPPSSQAMLQRDSNVGFSACAGLVGDAPLGLTRAKDMRPPGSESSRHPQCTAPHHVYATANGMSERSGTIIPQRPSHRAHTSSRPVNLVPQCRHGRSERGVLAYFRAPAQCHRYRTLVARNSNRNRPVDQERGVAIPAVD